MISPSPETAKREGNRDRLLRLLSDGRWHHMREMEKHGGMRFGARKFELVKQGHIIERRNIGTDEWEYRLVVENRQGVLI